MHIGWVAAFDAPEDGPSPSFAELADHIAGRVERVERYRQRLASVPFGLHDPVWVDDPGFDSANHLLPAEGEDLSALADSILSTPLRRDRPLWEMWIADSLPGGRVAIVGKAHHCMVDGAAVVELGNALFDAQADLPARGRRRAPATAASSTSLTVTPCAFLIARSSLRGRRAVARCRSGEPTSLSALVGATGSTAPTSARAVRRPRLGSISGERASASG